MGDKGDSAVSKTNDAGQKPGLDADTAEMLRVEASMRQQRHTQERSNPTIVDLGLELGHSALYSGVQAPVIGVSQLVDKGFDTKLATSLDYLPAPEHEEFGTARWHAQTLGGAGGMVLPFMLTRGALKSSGLTFAARTEATMVASSRLMTASNAAIIADGALTGFAYDFVLTPVQKGDDFWTSRRNHGLTGAATFGTLTAGSVALRAATRPLAGELVGAKRIALDVTTGASSGLPAGIVNANAISLLSEGRWANRKEMGQGAYTMAVAGGVLSALHKVPGQDLAPGDRALKVRSQNAGVNNLETMLAERARADRVSMRPEAATVSGAKPAVPEGTALGGAARKGSGSESTRMVSDRSKEGRALASNDVEGREIKTSVSPAQQALLQKGVDVAFKASEPGAPPADMVALFKYARGEGAALMPELLKVAEAAKDPALLTVIREAYLPIEGIEHRVIEGDAKINPEPGKPVTTDQLTRWKQFTEMVTDPPVDVEGYSKFRTDLFTWLDKNPDLHSWVQQFNKQNNWSNLAGPLDFYFQTNEMARFMETIKPRVEKPVTMGDIAKMRQISEEFAEQATTNPYEHTLIENFRTLSENSVGLNVPHLAKLINEALARKGLSTLCHVAADNAWQMTLYQPTSSVTRAPVGKVSDYNLVEPVRPEGKETDAPRVEEVSRIANLFGQKLVRAEDRSQAQYMFAETALKFRNEGVAIQDVPAELNHIIKANRMPYEVVLTKDGQLELNHVTKKEGTAPIISVFFDTNGKVQAKTAADGVDFRMTPDKTDGRESIGKVDYDSAHVTEAARRGVESAKVANEFGKQLDAAVDVPQAGKIFGETLGLLKELGVPAAEVPAELNKVLTRNKMPYEVVVTDGALELVFIEH
ncbi:MAG: hypothetical protein SGJ27_05845 [Candidatus Melainabacteria bacterium]|nr:hypothetical protein [Candidatus Melainabacteria bacterium]